MELGEEYRYFLKEATINDRNRCSYCLGRKVLEGNIDFHTVNPTLTFVNGASNSLTCK